MEQLLQIAIQAPFVALFVWFVLKNNREWRKYLTERNSKLEKAFDAHNKTLEKVNEAQEKHTRVLIALTSKENLKDINNLINS